MERSKAKKRANEDVEIQNNSKKRHLTSEDAMTTPIKSPYLKNYLLFPSKFNNFSFENLVAVDLSNNEIVYLPKQFGTLPFLHHLNLSRNRLRVPNQYKWLEQFAIRKNLRSLDISYNSLTVLPLCIDKLHALRWLNVNHNMLQCLPHRIGNFLNLLCLDISHNRLTSLPSTIIKLESRIIDISCNPYLLPNLHMHVRYKNYEYYNIDKNEVPSLKELSAEIVLKHRIKYDITSIPPELTIYLDTAENCNLCGRFCIERHCKRINENYYYIIHQYFSTDCTLIYKMEDLVAKIEVYCCLSCCRQYPQMTITDILNGIYS